VTGDFIRGQLIDLIKSRSLSMVKVSKQKP